MTRTPDIPSLAIIGCGAIAEMFHLPALTKIPGVRERLVLVDRDTERARAVAGRHGVTRHASDHLAVLGEVQGAVIAVPPAIHHRVALDCISAGVAVLCEKPLAQTAAEVEELVAAAEGAKVPIAVNNTRRLWPAYGKVAELVAGGAIGRPRLFTFRLGEQFDWPAATGSYFGRLATGGRGVLFDVGAHVLDLVCWWLGGSPTLISYRDDANGGTEADAEIEVELDGCRAHIRLSWLSKFPDNGFRVEGEKGAIEGGIYDWKTLTLVDATGRRSLLRVSKGPSEWGGFADRLAANFVAAIRGDAAPLVSAIDVLPSIALIDACYAHRTSFEQPWEQPAVAVGPDRSRIVLVTGAGGFIGGRVVEMLHGSGFATVRAGVRRWSSAARVGRMPVEIIQCDVTDREQARRAMDGTWAVVHCAVGSAHVTIEGTRTLLAAAEAARVNRVVHLSTVDVYGEATGEVTEERPYVQTGREYGDAKIQAEQVCMDAVRRGLPLVVLRPTLVHGPFSATWTIEFAERLQHSPWPLPEQDCGGTCNLLYVDDLVQAIRLALVCDAAVGQSFNVNGADRLTWSAYFRALNQAIGLPPLVIQDAARSHMRAAVMKPVRSAAKLALRHFGPQIMRLYQRSDAAKTVMKTAERAIKRTPTPAEFLMYSRVVSYDATKAARILGFRPAFATSRALELTAAWLLHHRVVLDAGRPAAAPLNS